MHILKLIQVGDTVGVILPDEVLARWLLKKGQSVFLTETLDGMVLTPDAPTTLNEQAEAGRAFMHEFGDSFRQLAK